MTNDDRNVNLIRIRRTITMDAARVLAAEAIEQSRRDCGAPIAVAVVGHGGDLVAFLRDDEAPLRASSIAMAKAYTAFHFGNPTRDLANMIGLPPRSWQDFADPVFTSLPGGMPLLFGSEVIGGVGISGRRPDDDHALAAAVLARFDCTISTG